MGFFEEFEDFKNTVYYVFKWEEETSLVCLGLTIFGLYLIKYDYDIFIWNYLIQIISNNFNETLDVIQAIDINLYFQKFVFMISLLIIIIIEILLVILCLCCIYNRKIRGKT